MKFVSRHSSFIFYLVAMLIIALIDGVMMGSQINLWILYGIPVGLATWNLGRVPGFVLAAMAFVLLLASSAIWGHPYASLEYLVIACVSRALAYLVLVGLVGELRKKEVERVFRPSGFR